MKYISNLLIFALLLLLTASCTKKWKKTSETRFDIKFVKSKSTVNYLSIDSGYLKLTNVVLEGTRKKGNDVNFSDQISSPVNFDISKETIESALIYDIPQGDYTRVEIDLRFDNLENSKPIVVKGFFLDSNEIDNPFQFELEDRIDLNITAKTINSDIITIISKNKTSATIKFNLIDWFEHLPQELLEGGEFIEIEGQDYLYINKTSNPNLYALIIGRIGQTAEIIFN